MANYKDPLIEALQHKQSYNLVVPDGGDLASMRAVLKHGQQITMSPVANFGEIRAGDIVLVKWRGGGTILHLVQEINGDQFLIVNSLGKVNGWVHGSAILGRATEIIDPPPRPDVSAMLAQLESACQKLVEQNGATQEETGPLLSIVTDLRWYAARLGPDRWEQLPGQNHWSFTSHLWHLTREASAETGAADPKPLWALIDHGKEHLGMIASNISLYEQEHD